MRQDSALAFRCEHCGTDKPLHWRVRWGWVCKLCHLYASFRWRDDDAQV